MSVTPFVSLTVEEFEQYLQQHPEAQLVDVRTAMEYAEGHLSGSINIDVLSPTFLAEAIEQLDTQLPVAVYCRSGARSKQAALLLVREGHLVTELDEGFLGWANHGKHVEG